jgi:nitrile hydratase subunit beta
MSQAPMSRKPHDMGGDPGGPIDRHEHEPTLVERRIDAMMLILRNKPRSFWVTDENRRTIESLAPETYRDSSYYEKWTRSMRSLLIEKGVLTEDEITARVENVRRRYSKASGSAT